MSPDIPTKCMRRKKIGCTHRLAFGLALMAPAQVRTEVPMVEPSAKPVTVERIKIYGAALEGNLDGTAVDCDVIVLLPRSYAKEKKRRNPVV